MSGIDSKISELLAAYDFSGEFAGETAINDGHINGTYAFTFLLPGGEEKKYLVQRINTGVFKDPVGLMENFVSVCEFLRNEVTANGGDPERECLTVYPTREGKPYYIDGEGGFWRCVSFVNNAHTVQVIDNPETFSNSALAFGKFQRMLAEYPIENLKETIPNFHNTVSRFADFKEAVDNNLSGRADTCRDEIAFALAREKDCGRLVEMIERGELPLRVTHNDTKLNNVMFDNETGEGICVVDLDTVMPGLSLYDFGDSIRFGASTAAEDEQDLDKVHFSLDYFRAYTEGFLAAAGRALTSNEKRNLAFASKLMTLECGMRFLGDYLNGDTYFKTDYPEHNLVRCRTQFRLVKEMEEAMDKMNETVEKICEELGIGI